MSPISLLALRPDQFDPDPQLIARAAAVGFDAVLGHGVGPASALPADNVAALVALCSASGLRALLSVDLAAFAPADPIVAAHPALFALRPAASSGPLDPRDADGADAVPMARLHADEAAEVLAPALAQTLAGLAQAGLGGVVLRGADRFGAAFLRALVGQGGAATPGLLVFAEGRDGSVLASLGLAGWISDAAPAALARDAAAWRGTPVLAHAHRDHLLASAAVADGLVVPVALLVQGEETVARAVSLVREAARFAGARRWSDPVAVRATSADWRTATEVLAIAVNDGAAERAVPAFGVSGFVGAGNAGSLEPGEVKVAVLARAAPIVGQELAEAMPDAEQPRLVVEQIAPGVDGGAYPVKRVVGEPVMVTAVVFADGHEQLAAELLWRPVDAADWQRIPMEQLPNDGWRAAFTPERLGRHEFAVEGWLDRFGGFQRDFAKKLAAGVAQPVDHDEGRVLVEQAATRTGDPALATMLRQLASAGTGDASAELLLSPDLKALMRATDDRPHALRSATQPLDAERIEARFSSWYELFPRSITDDPARHGTFRDVVGRLPAIRNMGFDTLYFPPIHPIGKTNRKGPNNTLTPAAGDPGSPYAIGSADGGHEALHPELGSFADFAALIDAAREHGLEIAIDFAIQCSPDHPWLKEHPGWFAWRPDGSMKYAENPPKKYQDIVNVDFYGPDAVPDLWVALRDIVLLWIERGVTTFRVDNPHTKPLPFWEWMIGDVRARHPEAIFLAEAFTRPNMMYRLAKIGFSQSYTYFTWRDTKKELTDYVVELTTTAPADFYRPHFFVNTPDINPIFLQTSGRPGFRIRAVLAATLSGLFGVYSGFELCEAAPIPGKEEYLDSEKFELRPRDWQAPGNIIADITLLNRLRRDNPALQTHFNTVFCDAANDQVIYYAKPGDDDGELILVMVSLDPFGPQDTAFEVPLYRLGLPDDASVAVEDLAEGYRFRWYGKQQSIRLDPDQPFRIWRIRP